MGAAPGYWCSTQFSACCCIGATLGYWCTSILSEVNVNEHQHIEVIDKLLLMYLCCTDDEHYSTSDVADGNHVSASAAGCSDQPIRV